MNLTSTTKALLYGAASVALYGLLYLFADETIGLAERTREGEKVWFLIPVVIAFVFSLVHGTFTAHFWDAVGLKAARQRRKG